MDSKLPRKDSHSRLSGLAVCQVCSFCSKTISCKKNLKRHLLLCKKNTENVSLKFSCVCGCVFTRKDNLKTHIKNCDLKRKKEKISCLFSHCKDTFLQKLHLINHLNTEHQRNIPVQTFKFNDESEFLSWKEKEETKSFSYYTKASGKKTSQVNTKNYYYCQHSGSDNAHRKKGEPARKSSRKKRIGQIKRNLTCISKITEVIFPNGAREVVYYPTHNHPLSEKDVRHQPVPKSLNTLINTQIAMNVPALEIYHSVQASVSGREKSNLNSSNEDNRKIAVSKKLIKQRIRKSKHNKNNLTLENIGEPEEVEFSESEEIEFVRPEEVEFSEPVKLEIGEHVKLEFAGPEEVEFSEPEEVEFGEPEELEFIKPDDVEFGEPVEVEVCESEEVEFGEPEEFEFVNPDDVEFGEPVEVEVGEPEEVEFGEPEEFEFVNPDDVEPVEVEVGEPEEVECGQPEVEFFNVSETSSESVHVQHVPSVSNALKRLQTDLSNLIQMVNDRRIPDHLIYPLSTEIDDLLKKYTNLSDEIQNSGKTSSQVSQKLLKIEKIYSMIKFT